MAQLRGFLGRDFDLPEDRLYDGRNYWLTEEAAGADEPVLSVGITAPGVALTGGLIEFEVFPEPGDALVVDQELAFATTKKNMKYFLSPLAGRVVEVNPGATAEAVGDNPGAVWLVKVVPTAGWRDKLLDASRYAAKLAKTEHATPEAAEAGKSGKSSPTCKSIYSGIKEA
jgi:glycine cleavage system H lipoate-binding protein